MHAGAAGGALRPPRGLNRTGMEPRPPRPRSPQPFEAPGTSTQPGIGERLYPTPGEQSFSAGGESFAQTAAEPPLMPRRQRRQRGAVRGIAITVAVVAVVAA